MRHLAVSFARAVFCALATAATSAGLLRAQEVAAPWPALTAETRARVIDSLTRTIERLYPAADTGLAIARHVRARAAAGAYRDATDPMLFARLLTQDLQATNEDTHLDRAPLLRVLRTPSGQRQWIYVYTTLGCSPVLDPLMTEPSFVAMLDAQGIRRCPVTTPCPIKPRPR